MRTQGTEANLETITPIDGNSPIKCEKQSNNFYNFISVEKMKLIKNKSISNKQYDEKSQN